MSAKEGNLLKQIQLQASKLGARLFRNNSAKTWIGKSAYIRKDSVLKIKAGSVVVENARRLHAGLGEWSSDLIGWCPVTITRSMVGKSFPFFTAIEGKTGRQVLTEGQDRFLTAIRKCGGFGIEGRDAKEVCDELQKRACP